MIDLKKALALLGTTLLLAQVLPGLMQQNSAQAATYPAAMQTIMSNSYPITMGNQFIDSSMSSSTIQRVANDLNYISINRGTDLFEDLGTSASIAKQIHAINPNVKVLQYLNIMDVWSYEPVTYPWMKSNNAFLYNDAGQVVHPYQSSYGTQRWAGNSLDTTWQSYYAQRALSVVNQGMDGIFSDNWIRSNSQGWNINATRFAQIQQGWNTMGQKAKAAIGSSKILIGNSPAWPAYQNSRDVDMLEGLNAPNASAFNYYLTLSNQAAAYGQAEQDTVNPSASESAILNFYLPACLLTDNVFGISNNSVQFAALEQVGKIGRPTDSRYTSGGVLQRDFTGGKVLLNNTSGTITVTLAAGVYSNVYGTKVNSVTLSSFTGAILKSSGSTTTPTTPTTPTSAVPPAPSGLKIVSLTKGATTGAEYVNLSWIVNATNSTQTLLQQSINSTSNFQTIQTMGGSTNSDSVNIGATPTAGTYYYRVISVNSSGQSVASATVNTPIGSSTSTPTTTIPAAASSLAPTGITKNSAGQVFVGLKWQNNATNAASVEILQSVNSTSAYKAVATIAASTVNYSLNIGAAPTHGTYYYEIIAANSAGQSKPSNVLGLTIN